MKTVLTEEEYFARLSAILKRDFFPLLAELDGDGKLLTESESRSLAQFQAEFTTEDNASFAELLARENERKRKGFERVYGAPAVLCDDPSRRLLLKDSAVDEEKVGSRIAGGGTGSALTAHAPVINLRATRFDTRCVAAHPTAGSQQPFNPAVALSPLPLPLPHVPLTPQINPSEEPIFTFGTVAATPVNLHSDGSETPSRYRIPPTPVREQVAHALAARESKPQATSRRRRSRRQPAVPKYSLSDLKSLTPKRK